MYRRLQRRFVAIAMGSLLLIITVIIGTINIYNFYYMNSIANRLLNQLADNDGRFPEYNQKEQADSTPGFDYQITPETSFETRYFTVRVSSGETDIEVDTSSIAAISSEQAKLYAEAVLSGRDSAGYQDFYKYLVVEHSDSTLIIFLDRYPQIQSVRSFLGISCLIAVLSLTVMFILVSLLSKRAIEPVIESAEKQKQFVTDAGHEIKTPLAIISANTEVLELYHGKNEWTASIHKQVNRLDTLVKSLLTLSKMEEEKIQLIFTEFSASELVWESVISFEALAKGQGKHFDVNIQPDLTVNGDESGFRQIVSILLDNAVKYTRDQGKISVTLQRQGKAVSLEVCNISDTLPEGDLNRLFDRFFRADPSRSQESGSYGIGLSIAKAIVQTHKGKIAVHRENDDRICFSVII